MKKLFTSVALAALTTFSFGQSQRFVLVEEFTGETCGPCAAQNPGFNAIMTANSTKGIAIKYQNNIPSNGPNFYAYNTADIATRTTYYANNYSPHGFLDGNVWNDVIGYFTAAMLTNQYAVTSPFDITVSHTLSPGLDSVYAHTVITATQAVSGTLKLRVAVVEGAVYGYTSPNGESSYENVMRKMLPSAAGTTLPTTWAVGDQQIIDLAWKISASTTSYPSPNPYQLRVVSFVQDDATKEIMQTGVDNTLISIDPALASVGNLSIVTCGTSVTPSVDFTNLGISNLTSLDIQYTLDAGTMQTYNWTGNLAPQATSTANLPSIAVTPGSHSINFTLANPNGTTDQVPQNNTSIVKFGVPVPSVAMVTQNFVSTTFPPTNWVLENPDNGYTWLRSTASNGGGLGSAKMDFYDSNAGNEDNLYVIEPLDLTTGTNPALTFDVAHRQYSAAYSDALNVDVSIDCGQTWNNVWTKSGATLSTVAGYTTSAFTPTNATQWRNELVSLSAYAGQSQVLVRFNAVSDYGNNCYVDNVNLSNALAVNHNEIENAVSLYPNPAKDKLTFSANFAKAVDLHVSLTDIAGKELTSFSKENLSSINYQFNVSKFAKGIYLLKITADGQTMTKKVTVE